MKNAPERMYGWLDSQLSLARHWGRCTFNGHKYIVDHDDSQQPLVREDIYKADKKRIKSIEKSAEYEKKKWLRSFDLFLDQCSK